MPVWETVSKDDPEQFLLLPVPCVSKGESNSPPLESRLAFVTCSSVQLSRSDGLVLLRLDYKNLCSFCLYLSEHCGSWDTLS